MSKGYSCYPNTKYQTKQTAPFRHICFFEKRNLTLVAAYSSILQCFVHVHTYDEDTPTGPPFVASSQSTHHLFHLTAFKPCSPHQRLLDKSPSSFVQTHNILHHFLTLDSVDSSYSVLSALPTCCCVDILCSGENQHLLDCPCKCNTNLLGVHLL